MLDPLLSLALNVTSTRGGYALLLGSGISRAAGILTGWEIEQDLIRRLATAAGEETLPDPHAWYRTIYGQDADYSALIDAIGGTEEERRQLLRAYFEATEEDRAQGLKIPTAAHRAIARLTIRGHVRVIVTTNFDRLQEQALEAEGLTPTVISTPDMAGGALPLIHTTCTLIKVHGDYMDTRIKNTAAELTAYDPRIDALLDEVIDTFGLIVCGWSATYDPALRSALERAASRRFTTYWATRGQTTPEAENLIHYRQASVITIDSADQFFEAVAEKVQALEDLQQSNPLTARVAAATIKRLLEQDQQIRAFDLVTDEIARLRLQIDDAHFPKRAIYNAEELQRRCRQYETLCGPSMALMAACGYWAKPGQERIWRQAVPALAEYANLDGLSPWIELARYPALLLLYAHGLAAVAARNDDALGILLGSTIWEGRIQAALVTHVNTYVVAKDTQQMWGSGYTPVSDHLNTLLREPLRPYIVQQNEYDRIFDRFEFIVGLVCADARNQAGLDNWGPFGRFAWRTLHERLAAIAGGSIRSDVVIATTEEIAAAGEDWPLLRAGLFGASHARLTEVAKAYKDHLLSATSRWIM